MGSYSRVGRELRRIAHGAGNLNGATSFCCGLLPSGAASCCCRHSLVDSGGGGGRGGGGRSGGRLDRLLLGTNCRALLDVLRLLLCCQAAGWALRCNAAGMGAALGRLLRAMLHGWICPCARRILECQADTCERHKKAGTHATFVSGIAPPRTAQAFLIIVANCQGTAKTAAMLRIVGAAQQPLLGAAEWLLSGRRPPPKPVVLPQGAQWHREGWGQRAGPRTHCHRSAAVTSSHCTVTATTLPGNAGFEPIPPTSEADLDAAISALQTKAPEWAATPPAGRAALLRACLPTVLAVAEEAAAAATAAKGSYGQGIGEELVVWVSECAQDWGYTTRPACWVGSSSRHTMRPGHCGQVV